MASPPPTREAFATWLCSVGMGNAMQAVVYDRQGANYCGRLWWMLKWLGHEAVAVLDGGLQAWEASGGALQSGPATLHPTNKFTLAPNWLTWFATKTIANNLKFAAQPDGPTIVDARGGPRFRGEVEPLTR